MSTDPWANAVTNHATNTDSVPHLFRNIREFYLSYPISQDRPPSCISEAITTGQERRQWRATLYALDDLASIPAWQLYYITTTSVCSQAAVCCSLSWILHLVTHFVDPAAEVHQSCTLRMALWGQKIVCTRLYLKYISARIWTAYSLCGYFKCCIKVVNKSQRGNRSLSRDSWRVPPEYGTRMDDGLLLTGCDHSLPNPPKFATLKANTCQLSFK